MAVASAAPVLGSGEADDAPQGTLQPPGRGGATTTPTVRAMDRALTPETSTGNKNLDLLLELQGRPGEEPRRPAARSAEASAAAAELAALRAKAAQRQSASQDDPARREQAERQQADRPTPPMQPLEGLGVPTIDARAAAVQRRDWSNQPGGDDGAGRAAGSSGAYDDDNPLRRLPREVIEFLRENRLWLLGAVGAIAVLGAALKAYSRRI